jgi:DNA invertase Pin-like site-specific DNA recombinase
MSTACIAIYATVSTRKQDTASQEPDLRKWAHGQSWPVAWYRDTFTGRTMERPGWNRLMQAVEDGQVGTIAVWRLDRLGRTAEGLTEILDELARRDVNLHSGLDGLNHPTVAARITRMNEDRYGHLAESARVLILFAQFLVCAGEKQS